MKQTTITPQFVELLPEQLQEGVLYISEKYCTAIHKCCCGCGQKVVTPLNPTDWSLRKDGNAVTLYPSIGNWSYKCRSHYWIRRSKVICAGHMSAEEIKQIRESDRATKQEYFEAVNRKKILLTQRSPNENYQIKALGFPHSLWLALKCWWNS